MHACGIDKKALSQGAKAYKETLEDDIMTATSKDTLDGEELLKILKRPEAKAIRGQWINWKNGYDYLTALKSMAEEKVPEAEVSALLMAHDSDSNADRCILESAVATFLVIEAIFKTKKDKSRNEMATDAQTTLRQKLELAVIPPKLSIAFKAILPEAENPPLAIVEPV